MFTMKLLTRVVEVLAGYCTAKLFLTLLMDNSYSDSKKNRKRLISDNKYRKYVNAVINDVMTNQYFSAIVEQLNIYANQNEMPKSIVSNEAKSTMYRLSEKDKMIRIKNKNSYQCYKVYKKLEILYAITPKSYGLQLKPLLDTFYRIFISVKDKEEMVEFDLVFSEIFSLDQSTDSLLTSLDYLYSIEPTMSMLYLFKDELTVRNKFNKKLVNLNKSLEEFIKFNKNLNPLSNIDSIRETLS